jgi:hypothetical protein
MIGLDKAQRAYDRMEPEDCSDEQDCVLYAEQLTDREIKLFAMDWLNESNDETSLHFMVLSSWVYGYPLAYDLQKYAEKWSRQAAFEAQLPSHLKQQAYL